jgi:flagellar protein FliO/FliZ
VRLRSVLVPLPALLLASGSIQAAEAPTVAAGLGQVLLGLGVVVALLLATLWLLKRVSAPRGGASALKVLGATSVGPRERVVLVEIAGKVLVLGVAPGRVNALHSFDAAELPNPTASVGTGPSNDLQDRLHRLVKGHK